MTKKSKSRQRRNHRRKAKVDAAVSTVTKQDELELEVMMQRLKLNSNVGISISASAEDDLLEEAIKLAAAEKKEIEAFEVKMNCIHGYERNEHIERFDRAFHKAVIEAKNSGLRGFDIFHDARKATASQFADVWSETTQIAKAINFFASLGTIEFLEGNKRRAGSFACTTNYFEQVAEVSMENTQPELDYRKLVELSQGDDRTLVSFFKKRIPCSCLDGIYKEVKSLKKKGVCWNENCKHYLRDDVNEFQWKPIDRSALMSCSRCQNACYCSVECQKADWSMHKRSCDEAVARKIAFDEAKCYRAT